MLTFRSSARLATAYRVAFTGTFLITTTLFLVVARARWHWPTWRPVPAGLVFGSTELTFLAANLTKVTHRGWLIPLVAAIVFTVMPTWQRGRQIVTAARRRNGRRGRPATGLRPGPAEHINAIAPGHHPSGHIPGSSISRRCSSVVSRWIARVSSVLVLSSSSCSLKS